MLHVGPFQNFDLTLMQTHKTKPFPAILVDSAYWKGLLDWMRNTLLAQGFISEEDLKLLRVCDTVDEVVDAVRMWQHNQKLGGKKAVSR